MSRVCTICSSPSRENIERALVQSVPKRRIAELFCVTEQALRRHESNHLPSALAISAQARQIAHADDLVGLSKRLQIEALEVLERAKATENLGGVLQAIDRLHKGVALLATLAEDKASSSGPTHLVIRWSDCPHHRDEECPALKRRHKADA